MNKKSKTPKDVIALNIIAYVFCTLIALLCFIPFIMVISGSFSSEAAISANGFSLLPQDFSLEAYKTVFKVPMVVIRAYATTINMLISKHTKSASMTCFRYIITLNLLLFYYFCRNRKAGQENAPPARVNVPGHILDTAVSY